VTTTDLNSYRNARLGRRGSSGRQEQREAGNHRFHFRAPFHSSALMKAIFAPDCKLKHLNWLTVEFRCGRWPKSTTPDKIHQRPAN
jgi:hypothetical protein